MLSIKATCYLLGHFHTATIISKNAARRIYREDRAWIQAAPRYLAGLLLRATVDLNAVVFISGTDPTNAPILHLRCGPSLCRARLPHIGRAPAYASFGSPSARFPPKGFRLSAVHLCTACSALRAIPSLRSALTAFGGYVLIVCRFLYDIAPSAISSAELRLAYLW